MICLCSRARKAYLPCICGSGRKYASCFCGGNPLPCR
ncbi:MAG: hypothetical protein HFH92_10945 [Lachnospiraceae bacterium]|nr:hypothetical protein [Lachnospiraceae bacterium]